MQRWPLRWATPALIGLAWLACGRLVDYEPDCQADPSRAECAAPCNLDADCPPARPVCAAGVCVTSASSCAPNASNDPDGDGVCSDVDCDDTNPFCAADCADADADGRCADHDCDDGAFTCGASCEDADGDGLADCDDPCVDADADGRCAGADDCDDAATTGAPCSSGCITAYLDRDGDGHGGTAARQACFVGPGLAARSDDCADLPEADPACGGQSGAKCHPGQSEGCADGFDNDCDGVADCAEPACNRMPCDDGLFCTVTDVCDDGVCAGSGDPCGPTSDGDCIACDEASDVCGAREAAGAACDDGVFCNGADTCDAQGGCSGHAGNPCNTAACSGACDEEQQACESVAPGSCFIGRACYSAGDRNPTNPCQECVPGTSQAEWTARSGSCDDGNACTYNDTCSAGACGGTTITCTSDAGACGVQRACNGTSACTVTTPGSSVTCDDSNACTYNDRCNGFGSCAGTAITCSNDAGTCGAQRSCNGTASCTVSYPGIATSCNDGQACTYNDRCNGAGGCNGTSVTCTSDAGTCGVQRTCNGTSTCTVTTPGTSTPCDDGAACTYSDRCNGAGGCAGTSITCTSDPGPCGAQRSCNGTASCAVSYAGTVTTCDDGAACTYSDRCNGAGSCTGTSITCSNDPGTCGAQRSCNGTATCATSYPGNATTCDDGDACTKTDRCNGAGACAGAACGNDCGYGCSYVGYPRDCAWTMDVFEPGWCTEGTQTRFYMEIYPSCDCGAATCSDAGNNMYNHPECPAGTGTSYVCCYHLYSGTRNCDGQCD